jgi:hypothetical protein
MKPIRVLLTLITTLLVGQGALAEVYLSVHERSLFRSCNFTLVIRGEIKPNDQFSLLESIKKIQSGDAGKYCFPEASGAGLPVQLDSPGGDVLTAMALGRIIRKFKIRAIVPFDSTCASSCVLVLAGAVVKSPYGKVGIHRPYAVQGLAGSSIDDIRKRQDVIRSEIRRYLNEVDVSSELIERMLSIPPEEIRFLAEAELKALRLFGKDASFEEFEVTQGAEIFSITNAEYRRRSTLKQRVCKNYKGYEESICQLSVFLNVSLEEAERRDTLSEKCLKLDYEQQYRQCLKLTYSGRPYTLPVISPKNQRGEK